MRLVDRLRISVHRRAGTVVLRSDVAGLGGASQVSEGLRMLIAQGRLVRLGEGIYAKALPDADGNPVPEAGTPALIEEVLHRLGIDPQTVRREQDGARHKLVIEATHPKVDRHLEVCGSPVEIVTLPPLTKAPTLPEDPSRLPRHGVRQYIERLAQWHRITASPSSLDRWTEAVSRAAGDTVQLDAVGRLLAKLKQEHVISGRQMAHLMNNYVMERDRSASHV